MNLPINSNFCLNIPVSSDIVLFSIVPMHPPMIFTETSTVLSFVFGNETYWALVACFNNMIAVSIKKGQTVEFSSGCLGDVYLTIGSVELNPKILIEKIVEQIKNRN